MSSSKSSANQSQSQDSQDNRIAAAQDSVNLVASRSSFGNIGISTTDHGAVDGAFKFANASSDSAFKFGNAVSDNATRAISANSDSAFKFGDSTVSQSFDFAKMITAGAANENAASGARSNAIAKSAMDSVKEAYTTSGQQVSKANEKVTDTLAAAYETAKAGEQKIMVAAGLAIVALVAIKSFGKAA